MLSLIVALKAPKKLTTSDRLRAKSSELVIQAEEKGERKYNQPKLNVVSMAKCIRDMGTGYINFFDTGDRTNSKIPPYTLG